MADRRDGEPTPTLERLSTVVRQRTSAAVWRAFLVAQTQVRETHQRRREMTTQKIFLLGQQQRTER
jgi:hypothetical protein